jgi:transposase
MVQKQLLHKLFSENWSARKINRATGIHRKTIAQYKKEWQKNQQLKNSASVQRTSLPASDACHHHLQNVPPDEKQVPTGEVVHFQVPTDTHDQDLHTTSKSKAAPYDAVIREKLEHGQHARSIYQDLVVEHQYQGSYDSVKRYIRKLSKKSPKLYARIETAPGEEAQVDFGEGAPTLKNNRYYKPWLFVMTLSNSRKSYQETVWKQDVETFLRCHEHAFQFFGGVPNIIKIDNLKSGVLKAHLYEPELNPNYLAFSQHYGFVPLPCRVATPQHKGKVESNIKYVQNNALQGKRFSSLDQQNTYLRFWNKTWASTRIHGTTKKQVQMMFETEKPYLKSLPATSFEFFKIGTRKVNVLDSHIEVAGAYYPIPPHYIGKRVIVHYNSKYIKVYYQQQLIQQLSTVAKGRFHPDKRCLPKHKTWEQNQYITYLFDKCQKIGPDVLTWAQKAEQLRNQRAYRSIQGVIALRRHYPDSILNWACRQSLEQQAVSYHVVKKIAEQIRLQKDIQKEIHFTQQSDVIRSLDEYQHLLTGDQ